MKKHMTQMELTQTKRLIESGVIEIEKIQESVFCHADCIKNVLSLYDIEVPEPPKPQPKAKVTKKASAKKSAVAKAAAKAKQAIS